jgi:hypothetical protein
MLGGGGCGGGQKPVGVTQNGATESLTESSEAEGTCVEAQVAATTGVGSPV